MSKTLSVYKHVLFVLCVSTGIFSDGKGFHAAVEDVLNGADVDTVTVPDRNQGADQGVMDSPVRLRSSFYWLTGLFLLLVFHPPF